MALTDIVSLDDVEEGLELTTPLTGAQSALMDKIRLRVESMVRQLARHNITTDTYTHFFPSQAGGRDVIQLRMPYLTSVTSVYEDYNAKGGQGASDFPASTLLTAGVDYQIETEDLALSRQGQLRRCDRLWSPYPRTVKVTYVAGLTPTHLANEFLFVKQAIIDECVLRFLVANEESSSDAKSGPLVAEKIGDWSGRWGEVKLAEMWPQGTGRKGLSVIAAEAIEPIIYYGVMT